MLLFKSYHVLPIICGNPGTLLLNPERFAELPADIPWGIKIGKTHTRRSWKKCRVKVGSIHQCKLNFYDPHFAMVQIREVSKQPLGEMTEEDARKEGGYTLEEYARLWQIINKKPLNPLQEVFVIEMMCVQVNISSADLLKYGSMHREHMQVLRSAA